MTPRLSFHHAAVRDIAAAARWYEGQITGLGVEFMSTLDSVLAAVLENPRRFPIATASRRRALLGRFPYALIFETLDPDGIRIIACHHHRQSPKPAALDRFGRRPFGDGPGAELGYRAECSSHDARPHPATLLRSTSTSKAASSSFVDAR